MTWCYERNGLVIAHYLDRTADGTFQLTVIDFDGFTERETFAAESAALTRQMALERALLHKGWGLETYRRRAA